MLGAAGLDIDAACAMEAEAMAQLFGTPVNRALVNVFFLTDRNKKDRGVDSPTVQPRKINSVAVVGAGIMGAGIAAANAEARLAGGADRCIDAGAGRGRDQGAGRSRRTTRKRKSPIPSGR